jgi:hypothetical protein
LRRLPRTGFSHWSAIAFALLIVADVLLLGTYMYLGARGLWLVP